MAKAFRLKTLHPPDHQPQAAILRSLEVSPRVAWAERMNTGAIKIPAANGRDRFLRFGFPGCPDILGQMTDGRLLAIEVKSPSGRASEAQAAFLALVATHGGVAVLARSLDDLTHFLEMPA